MAMHAASLQGASAVAAVAQLAASQAPRAVQTASVQGASVVALVAQLASEQLYAPLPAQVSAVAVAASPHTPPAFAHSKAPFPVAPLQTDAWEHVAVPSQPVAAQAFVSAAAVQAAESAATTAFPSVSLQAIVAFQLQPRWVQVSTVVESEHAAGPSPLLTQVAAALPHVAAVSAEAAAAVNTQPSAALQESAVGSSAADQVPPAVAQSAEFAASAPSHVARNEHVAVPPHEPVVQVSVDAVPSVAAASQSALVFFAATAALAVSLHTPGVHLHPRGPASQSVWLLKVPHAMTPVAAGWQSTPTAAVPAAVNEHPAGQLAEVGALHEQPFTTHCAALSNSAHVTVLAVFSGLPHVAGTAAAATTSAVNVQPLCLLAAASSTVTEAQVSAVGTVAAVHTPPAASQSTGLTWVVELPAPNVQIAPWSQVLVPSHS